MSTQKLKLVEYSDSSSEGDNGEDGKHMADNEGQKSRLDSEVQKVQSDSEGQKFQDSEVQKVNLTVMCRNFNVMGLAGKWQ